MDVEPFRRTSTWTGLNDKPPAKLPDQPEPARRPRRRSIASLALGVPVLGAMLLLIASFALAASPSFSDVSPSDPYHTAIIDLASRGVISGYPDGAFRPGSPVTRQQFAKMIVKALKYPVSEANTCPFADVPASLPGSFVDATDPLYPDHYVAVCADRGITLGKTGATFAPYDGITRQQLITMVARAANVPSPPDAYVPPFSPSQFSLDEHYQNARRAAHAGLLDGLQGMGSSYGFLDQSTRAECAQLLHNLLLFTEGSATTSSSTTTTTAPSLGYESLGGSLNSGPGAASWTSGSLRVFVRGPSDALWYRTFNAGTWSPWTSAGQVLASGPAVLWQAVDDCRVFWLGTDGSVWGDRVYGSTWIGPRSWGVWPKTFTSGPAVAAWGPGRFDLFARGTDNALWAMTYEYGSNWWVESAWSSLGGELTSEPAAVAWGPKRIDVFARGPLDRLFHIYYDGKNWSSWEDLGGILLSGPAVVSQVGGLLDVFAVGPGGVIWHRPYHYLAGWSDWEPIPGTMTFNSAPAAVSWGPGRIDLFARGTDDALWHKWWDGVRWNP